MNSETYESLVNEFASNYDLIELDHMSKRPLNYVNHGCIEYEFFPSILREAMYVIKLRNK